MHDIQNLTATNDEEALKIGAAINKIILYAQLRKSTRAKEIEFILTSLLKAYEEKKEDVYYDRIKNNSLKYLNIIF